MHEVIVDGSCFDEGTLGIQDEGVHVRPKPEGGHLKDDLSNHVNEANGLILRDPFRPSFLARSTMFANLSQLGLET